MEDKCLGFVLYTNGRMFDGVDGVDYDRPPCGGFSINVNSGVVFEQFVEMVCHSIGVDVGQTELEIVYRHPNLSPSGSVKFMPIPISNDQALNLMFSVAMPVPNLVHLYVTVKNIDVSHQNLDETLGQCPESIPCSNPEPETIAPSCDDEELEPDNCFIELRTQTDDEFEELYFDDSEHVIPSETFIDLDMDVVDSISEHDPVIGPVAVQDNILYRGLVCRDKEVLQHLVKRFAISCHAPYEVIESTPSIWHVRCKKWEDGCQWRLRGIKKKSHGLFEITKYFEEHSCYYSEVSQTHAQLDSSMIAVEFIESVRAKPSISVFELQANIKDKFGYNVPYRRVWDGKRKALVKVFGDWDDSYKLLPKWLYMVKHTNPGTHVEWKVKNTEVSGHAILTSVFWAFGPCIQGFKKCRPIIQIDGTHLYGKYTGKLLVATSIDSNGKCFPLAFAVVDEECRETWGWFLRNLKRICTHEQICLISDRHGGIISAVNNPRNGWSGPNTHHRFCLRHIVSNFNQKYKCRQLKNFVYRAGSQHQVRKFNKAVEDIKTINSACMEFFNNIGVEKWTQAHDGGFRYGWMTTNMVECINGVLKGARMLPITALAQMTFYRCVKYFEKRREEIRSALTRRDKYTRYAHTKIVKWAARSSMHYVQTYDRSTGIFHVKTGIHYFNSKGGNMQIIRLSADERTCTCNKWQTYGIPCSHLMAVCSHLNMSYEDFIEDTYKLSTYEECYSHQFQPIPHEDYWVTQTDIPILHADKNLLRAPGRPKSSRYRNEMDWTESSSQQRCGLCKQLGHNRRKCPSRSQRETCQ